MAKKTARAKNPGGPFLAAAVLCENILKDSSGMSSIIHMLDNVTVQIHPQEDAHPQFIITLHLYLSFRTGSARGKHKITITAENPDGERKETSSETMEFGKEQHSSSNVEARVNLGVKKTGLYWFDVYVDGKLMTRVPLNVNVVKLEMPVKQMTADPAGLPKIARPKRT